MTSVRSLIAAALASVMLHGAAAAQAVVSAPSGSVRGVTSDGVTAFKGLRFAQPPLGDLRWRPPRALAPWDGVKDAASTGPACPQHLPPEWGADPRQSEDCLYLNIWRPAGTNASSRLPVMVWIYGGAFVIGDSASAIYDGSKLARDGVIVVNFNYRLGRLGWFALPELTREAGPEGAADFGLMDQIQALKWVRDNIAAYGGDPSNVTIFGESAGGMSVNLLMVSPAARGLFAKAITQSGLGRADAKPLAAAEAQGQAFATSVGARDLQALRRLPASVILGGAMASVESGQNPGPILDGRLIPENVAPAFAAGRQAAVPWIVGSNDYEASLFPGLLTHPEAVLYKIPASVRPMVTSAFDPKHTGDPRAIAANLLTDSVFTEPARHLAALQIRRGVPVYRYVFAYTPEADRATSPGAGHGAEIQFVFDTLGTFHGSPSDYTASDRRISLDMGRYWTDFAKTGDPNGSGLAMWPKDSADAALLIDVAGPHAATSLHKVRLDLMEARANAAAP